MPVKISNSLSGNIKVISKINIIGISFQIVILDSSKLVGIMFPGIKMPKPDSLITPKSGISVDNVRVKPLK